MKQTTIVAIILAVLVLISIVQAFQLSGLKTDIKESGVSAGSSTSSVSASSSGGNDRTTGSLPSSIKNLPQMVGGC